MTKSSSEQYNTICDMDLILCLSLGSHPVSIYFEQSLTSFYIKYKLQESARLTVPGGPSVACSTAAAIAWDKAWANNLDPSGRAATGVHDSAYEGGEVESSAVSHKEGGEDGLANSKVGDKVQEAIAVA